MSLAELVNPSAAFGGLNDGYRRNQLGVPTSSVGKHPRFRGEVSEPTRPVKAPKILSSAGRQNRGSNITLPYARVASAQETQYNGDNVSPGDLLWVERPPLASTDNPRTVGQREVGVHAHAMVHRIIGTSKLDELLQTESVVVVTASRDARTAWMNSKLLQQFALDGVCLSDDAPWFSASSASSRDDRVFNVAIQGSASVNNGYVAEDRLGMPIDMDTRSSAHIQKLADYKMGAYPLQSFDRNVGALNELYVGIVETGTTAAVADTAAKYKLVYFSSRQLDVLGLAQRLENVPTDKELQRQLGRRFDHRVGGRAAASNAEADRMALRTSGSE